MKKYSVKIVGNTPYMQHRMDTQKLEDWEKSRGAIIERDDVAKEDAVRAEFHCYRNANGKCYIPSEQIRASLINAGGYVKAKVGNANKSMKNIVAAMFFITPEQIEMPDYDQIDKRTAVNKLVKARIVTIRPKWSIWSAEFTLLVDNDTITDATIKNLFEYSGHYCGIGSFRPTNNGMFGRFEVEKINVVK